MKKSPVILGALALSAVLTLTGCFGDTGKSESAKANDKVNSAANERTPYIPKNDVEYNNYNKAQEVADNPASILWCTAFPAGGSAPIITIPIKGKLTSSSTSYFPGQQLHSSSSGSYGLSENRSVDGMYHGNPPGYRFGFTPGGQYVSFEGGMNTLCTTALTQFQRQNTFISVDTDSTADAAQKEAEAALKAGDPAKAQDLLEAVGTK